MKSGVTWTVRRCIDGTFAAATGTATEDGTTGWYKFAMSQADTNGNNIQFNFTGTGAVPQTVNIVTDGSPPDVNLKNAAGTAVTLDANNVLNVSTKYVGGTLQTAGDIPARLPAALTAGGFMKSDPLAINGVSTSGVTTVKPVIGLTTADTITTLTNLPSIPANWLTAAGINAGALNGKGDWLLASGYTAPLDAAGIRSAVGLSLANLDGQLNTIDGDVLAAADNVWRQAFSSYTNAGTTGKVLNDAAATIAANLTAVVAPASTALSSAVYTNARAAKLDNLDAAVSSRAATGDAMTLTSGERDSIADAHIARNIAGGSSTGRTVKDVYAAIRNKVAIVGTTMTVYSTDDTTTLWTATLTTDGTAVPITAMDPA